MSSRLLYGIPGSRFTGPSLYAAARLRTAQWDRHAADPEASQRRILRRVCSRVAGTHFGRTHGLSRCRTYEDFRSAVQVREYTDYLPWLTRMREGERDVLWPGFVPFFALSGGTTSGPGGMKYLPVSREQLATQLRMAFDAVARYVTMSGDRALTAGYSLALVPPAVIRREGAVGVSSNPGLLHHHGPKLSKVYSLPRQPVSEVEDFAGRLTAIAEAYLDHDVRLLAGTPCWFSVLFEKLLEVARARGRDARTVRDVWPNLNGLITGGASPLPYRPLFTSQLGEQVLVVDHYNSTEAGLIACADRRDADDMLMLPDRGVFYEFVRRDEYDRPGARRVPLWQVEPGRDYAVLLTTQSGLLAYSLGDVVRFTSCSPHRVKIIGRLRGGLSPVHEVTSEDMVEAAVAAACASTRATTTEFTSAADEPRGAGGKSRYRLFVEFARAPSSLDAFRWAFDAELCRQNRLYAVYRTDDVLLLEPEVVVLPRGSADRFMRALGARSLQQKFPRTLDQRRRAVLEKALAS